MDFAKYGKECEIGRIPQTVFISKGNFPAVVYSKNGLVDFEK